MLALLLYITYLILLTREINPRDDFSGFMVKALVLLSVPFSVILLQELLELITIISGSTLRSTAQQFQIVVLVLVRSFFKDFGQLNSDVSEGVFGESVQKAVIKLIAIVVMTTLMIFFRQLSRNQAVKKYSEDGLRVNLYKEMSVILLVGIVLLDLIAVERSFLIMEFIRLVFTGMIIVDSAFFIISIAGGHEFNKLMLEGGTVIGLIFARFALFANNALAYVLSTLGIAFATSLLFLFVWSHRQKHPGEIDW